MTAEVVEEFSTGYLRTRVLAYDDGRYAWQRGAGPDRPAPVRTAPDGFAERALGAAADGVRFVVADGGPDEHGTLRYEVPGPLTAATLLTRPSDPECPEGADRLPDTAAAAGRALRALHDGGPLATSLPPAPGPARALAWLDAGTGPRGAAALHERLRTILGPTRRQRVREWLQEATEPGPGDTVLHGFLSLGQLVLARTDPRRAVILAGEDAAHGRAELDLGWLVGELVELRMLAQLARRPRPLLTEVRDRFLAAYGPGYDPEAVARAAVLRILTHTHDFASYIGWHPELLLYARYIAAQVDDEGIGVLGSW